MSTLDLARKFIDAVEVGNQAAARDCMTLDARIWHNFDDKEQTVDENMALMAWMTGKAQKRNYEITRLEEIEGGYVQQHILTLVNQAGETLTMHACVIASVRDGKISKIEEYLDPAKVARLS